VARWVALGLILSSSVVVVISISSGVTLSDLARLGYLQFGLAVLVSSARLLLQVLRFKVMVIGLIPEALPNLKGITTARMGSEFVALSTPASIGGEFLRAAWLKGKGVPGGKALWIGYFEVLIDVYVGSALALVAAAFAFSRGATAIGFTIGTVASVLIVAYTAVFLVPALRGIPVMSRKLFGFMERFVGARRAHRLEAAVQRGSTSFSLAARSLLSWNSLPVILKVAGLTVIQAILSGMALWLVLTSAGLRIDLLSSTLVTYGALAVAAIPISIGGSGLIELAVQAYLSSVFGFSSWAAIVFWRIASYQAILAITSVAFLILVRNATKRTSEQAQSALPVAPKALPVWRQEDAG
jgi:uncharacterized protein (TIRG00374 family)